MQRSSSEHTSRSRCLARAERRGTALLYALVLAVVIAGLCAALLGLNLSTKKSRIAVSTGQRAFYAAEAGLSDAFVRVMAGSIAVDEDDPTVFVGTPDDPIAIGSSDYWVRVQRINARDTSLASTGTDGADQRRLELVVGQEANGFFQYAAFGADGVTLDSNAFIDSYDSVLGDYASQVAVGNTYALENGHVGSNADVVLKANTEIHGDVRPGPGGVVDDSAPNVFISGSTEPNEELIDFPPIAYPVAPSSGSISGTQVVTLGPGLVHYDSINLNGGSTLTIQGPAQIVVDDLLMRSNTEIVFDTTDGKIELYAPNDFVLLSNSTVTTVSNTALDVTLLLGGNNTTKHPPDNVQLGSNAQFVGAIYAPDAEFSLSSNFEIFGSIMCDYLDLSSFGEIHFDEALLYDGWGATEEPVPVYWHRLPLEDAGP